MIEKNLMNFNFVIQLINEKRYVFLSVVISYMAMMFIPICILAIGLSSYRYFYTYFPNNPDRTYSLFLSSNDQTRIQKKDIKAVLDPIDYFTTTQDSPYFLQHEGIIKNIVVSGIDQDLFKIFNLQLYKTSSFSHHSKELKTCWIGSTINSTLSNPKIIRIKDKSYFVEGIIHNKQLSNHVLIDSQEYATHFGAPSNFCIQLNNGSSNVHNIKNFLQKKFNLSNEVNFYDWKEHYEYNKSRFISVLGIITMGFVFIILFGILNVYSIMIMKQFSFRKVSKVQWILGISSKQLYFQEWLYISISLFLAIFLDFLLLVFCKPIFRILFNQYIALDIQLVIFTLFFSFLTSLNIAYMLMRKQIKQFKGGD